MPSSNSSVSAAGRSQHRGQPGRTTLAFLAAAAVALLFGSSLLAGDWPTYRHDNHRSGWTDELLELPLPEAWTWRSKSRPTPAWGSPARADYYTSSQVPLKPRLAFDRAFDVAIVADTVYLGCSADDTVYALDARTSAERWAFTAEGPVRMAPSVALGNVYFGADDGVVYAVGAGSGALRWKYTAAGAENYLVPSDGRFVSPWAIRSGVVIEGGNAYFSAGFLPAEGVFLCAVDARTGASTGDGLYRQLRIGDVSLQGYILASSSRLFLPAGRSAPYIFARSNGNYVGQVASRSTGARGTFALLTDTTIVTGPAARGGAILEEFSQQPRTDSIATYSGGNVIVVTADASFLASDNELVALQRSNRSVMWRRPVKYPYSLIVAGDLVLAGGDGEVAAFDAQDGSTLWTAAVDGRAYGLAAANGTLFVSTDSGAVHAFGSVLPENAFVRGDANADGDVNIADPVRVLVHLFAGAPLACADHGDADDSGSVNLTDAVYLLEYLYRAGPPPSAPFPIRGVDATPDAAVCGDAS